MKLKTIKGIFKKIKTLRIGIIGDFSLDAYWNLDSRRKELSLETGKRVNVVSCQQYSLGGASNVAANLSAIGASTIKAFGITGKDIFRNEMISLLKRARIDCQNIIIQEKNWHTTVFAKPYIKKEEQHRYDFGTYNIIEKQTEDKLMHSLKQQITRLDALIINQQIPKGYHSNRIIKFLNSLAKEYKDCLFLVDSRHKCKKFKNMIIKTNSREASLIYCNKKYSGPAVPKKALLNNAIKIYKQSGKPVFITRGRKGIFIYDGKDPIKIPGIKISGKIDTVGAGDTITSILAATLALKATLKDVGEMANYAATVTVKKLKQTGTASQKEIMKIALGGDLFIRE